MTNNLARNEQPDAGNRIVPPLSHHSADRTFPPIILTELVTRDWANQQDDEMLDDLVVVAVNVFEPQKSQVIAFVPPAKKRLAVNTFDYSQFVGGGYEICWCRKIYSEMDANNTTVVIENKFGMNLYETTKIVAAFPLIEGELAPGIYRLSQENECYAVTDLAVLSRHLGVGGCQSVD